MPASVKFDQFLNFLAAKRTWRRRGSGFGVSCAFEAAMFASFQTYNVLMRRSPVGLTYVTVALKAPRGRKKYQANFLADTGATDTLVPATELRKIGVKPVGKVAYELADGSLQEYQFGLVEISFVEISFMGEITAGRVIFGPNEGGAFARCNGARIGGHCD